MQDSITNWVRICANKTASSSTTSFATRSQFWNTGKIFRVCLDHITMTAKHCPALHVLYIFARNSGEGEMKLKEKNMAKCHMGHHRRYRFEPTFSGASPQHMDNLPVQATEPLISSFSGATLNLKHHGSNFLSEANKCHLFSTAKK